MVADACRCHFRFEEVDCPLKLQLNSINTRKRFTGTSHSGRLNNGFQQCLSDKFRNKYREREFCPTHWCAFSLAVVSSYFFFPVSKFAQCSNSPVVFEHFEQDFCLNHQSCLEESCIPIFWHFASLFLSVAVGPINISLSAPSYEEMEPEFSNIEVGGTFKPKDCVARHRVAILIPYRNRTEHLKILLYNLHQMLPRQQIDYGIFVIEQVGFISHPKKSSRAFNSCAATLPFVT